MFWDVTTAALLRPAPGSWCGDRNVVTTTTHSLLGPGSILTTIRRKIWNNHSKVCLLTEKDEKFVEFWALRYSNYFGYFKGDFHLKIYLNVGDQRTRMGWEAPQPTSDSSSTQLLHLALAGLELDHQPPTQELINEGWNTKSIFTLCFVVRSIIEPYQFEMLLAWGCWGHRTAANSNSVYSFCGLACTVTQNIVCKIWNMDIYHCSCFLLSDLIFNNTNNILTLKITHTHDTSHRNRQSRNDNQLLLTIFLSHIMTHK